MRIIDRIPHPDMTISIFHMNDKYIVKFEAGPMEQAFKFTQEETPGAEAVKKRITPEFISEVSNRFNEMFLQWQKALGA